MIRIRARKFMPFDRTGKLQSEGKVLLTGGCEDRVNTQDQLALRLVWFVIHKTLGVNEIRGRPASRFPMWSLVNRPKPLLSRFLNAVRRPLLLNQLLKRRFRILPSFLGLQMRVTSIVSTLVGLSVVATCFLLFQVTNEQFRDSLAKETRDLAVQLERRLGPEMVDGEQNLIDKILEVEFSRNPHIAFIEIRGVAKRGQRSDEGEVLGRLVIVPECWEHYRTLSSNRVGTIDSKPSAQYGPASLDDADFPEGLVYEYGLKAEASNRAIGTVLLGMVDPGYRGALLSLQGTALIIVSLVFFGSIPFTAILVRRVTRPLRQIASAAEEFSIARDVRMIKVHRRDEIGQLAESFNRMAERLSDAHEALLLINEGLEETVSERTTEIRLTNDLLKQEVDSKNEFIRTITHDLNAPLRNIAGMAQMIRKHHGEGLPAEVLQRIERIEANVALETSMLDDLLELSRLRTRTYRREDLDVAAIFEEIRLTLEPEMLEHSIEWEVAESFPTIHLEPRLFRQVFLNLIDNAIKYMGDQPTRRISIDVALEEHWLVLSVTDTGPGIMVEAQERVFELFSRGSAALGDESLPKPGRGVGLANVKTVVERWEGTIELESEIGAGCRFVVRLPISQVVGDWGVRLKAADAAPCHRRRQSA